jgi:hypothetical protein
MALLIVRAVGAIERVVWQSNIPMITRDCGPDRPVFFSGVRFISDAACYAVLEFEPDPKCPAEPLAKSRRSNHSAKPLARPRLVGNPAYTDRGLTKYNSQTSY